MKEYPRILVISSNAFSASQNNGKTMECLLDAWPNYSIAHSYFSEEREHKDYCKKFFTVTYYDAFDRIISIKKKDYIITERNVDNLESKSKRYSPIVKKIHKELRSRVEEDNILQRLRRDAKARTPKSHFIDLPLLLNRRWILNELVAWLDDFDPQIILFQCSGSLFLFKLIMNIYEKYNIPIIMQCLDDFTTPLYSKSLIEKLFIKKYIKLFKQCINKSSAVITISDKMAREYATKFGGKAYFIFSNAKKIKCSKKDYRVFNSKICFLYVGNLGHERINVLAEFGKKLDDVSDELNRKIELRVFSSTKLTTEQNKLIENILCFRLRGFITPDKISSEINDADFLLHVESFSDVYKKMVRLSISTKIGEYLSSNRCIIAIGPNDIASIEYIKSQKLGFVITDSNFGTNIIKEILSSQDMIEEFIHNANKEFYSRYTQEKISGMMDTIIEGLEFI